jgi:hypothetical protein
MVDAQPKGGNREQEGLPEPQEVGIPPTPPPSPAVSDAFWQSEKLCGEIPLPRRMYVKLCYP